MIEEVLNELSYLEVVLNAFGGIPVQSGTPDCKDDGRTVSKIYFKLES